MGQRVEASALVTGRPGQVRRRLDRSIAALRVMARDGWFIDREPTIGMEIEFDLVDPLGRPRLVNEAVLARLDNGDFQRELSRFNIEFNLPPRPLHGWVFSDIERDLADAVGRCAAQTERLGARLVAIGTLPTARPEHLTYELLSSNPRYALLSRRIRTLRKRMFRVLVDGPEVLSFRADSVAPEAAATSLQLHLRVPTRDFAAYFNVMQAIAGIQVAVGANSPYLFGRRLWHETRIALCEQVLDTRCHAELVDGAAARVCLGERWVRDPIELFADLVEQVPPLLPTLAPEDPDRAIAAGAVPALTELRLHSGTVWRWNRPVYDVQDGIPQLRIENRVLPSGPTLVDMVANAAFSYGLLGAVRADPAEICWPFRVAEDNLHRAARDGLAATLRWGRRQHAVRELVLDRLLPLAADGLAAWGVDPVDRDHYLGVVERRVALGRTGAAWQIATVRNIERACGADRTGALLEMTRRYMEHARSGAPVHEWPIPAGGSD